MDNVVLARAIMGTSLGFHIVFAVLGVGMPALMSVAEAIGLLRHDPAWIALARRWAKAFGLIFAIGAVSGTALSFELGLLWPGFMAFSGSIIGLPFSAEGFAFFIEAIFLGLYLYGWDRLRPLTHWLCSLPVAISGAASSLFVVMTNAWMNSPTGFVAVGNRIIRVDPLAAAFNRSTPTEDIHMLVSAYLVTGFAVAAVYAAGFLRGHGDALHRRALPMAMVMAVVSSGLAGITGDTSARFVAGDQPLKFASQEGLFPTTSGAPLHIGGVPLPSQNRMVLAIEIPHLLSWLTKGDPNATIKGLDAFPRDLWPNVLVVHFSFQLMVALGLALGLCSLLYWLFAVRRRAPPTDRWLLVALVFAGPASVVAMETGWFVTEFGRQPWIIYGVMRTSAAATSTPALGATFAIFLVLYLALGITLARLLVLLAQRERRHAPAADDTRPQHPA
jgi:cytochrome bd ubiquinol oxidase subunit I